MFLEEQQFTAQNWLKLKSRLEKIKSHVTIYYWTCRTSSGKNNCCRLLLYLVLNYLFMYLFWQHYPACGILVPRSGIKAGSLSVESQSLNHWTTREVTCINYKRVTCYVSESLLWEMETDLEIRLLKWPQKMVKRKDVLLTSLPHREGN